MVKFHFKRQILQKNKPVVEMEGDSEINTLEDLQKLALSVDEARAILKFMGAQFEPIPAVDLGNLRLDNVHADYYVDRGLSAHRKTRKGWLVSAFGGFDPEWKINRKLIIKSLTPTEGLLRYANMIKNEYADLDDKKLLDYSCLGRKRFHRARDECLRRGLISKVGD